jgi:MFS family permease
MRGMSATNTSVKHTGPIRAGGLVAMVAGAMYAVAESLDLPDGVGGEVYYGLHPGGGSLFYNALLVGAMAATLAIAALYTLRSDRYGIRRALVSVVAFIGLALMLWGELGNLVATLLGVAVGSLSVVMLGLVTATVGVRGLPRWSGIALIFGSPVLCILVAPLGGVAWALVGFALFRVGAHQAEQPSRVH